MRENIRFEPATVIDAASPISSTIVAAIRQEGGLEDGPTLTHGEMGYGAGVVAALRRG